MIQAMQTLGKPVLVVNYKKSVHSPEFSLE